MTTKEAALVIGCSVSQIRLLIAHHAISAKKVANSYGYRWKVNRKSVEQYKNKPQTKGYPRGQHRVGIRGPRSSD